MDKIKKIGFWLIKNLGLFLFLYVADQIIVSLLGLRPSIYQAILLWLMVKVILLPFKIKKRKQTIKGNAICLIAGGIIVFLKLKNHLSYIKTVGN